MPLTMKLGNLKRHSLTVVVVVLALDSFDRCGCRGAIRDARPDEASALEALQRRSSDVWEEYRAQLAANPDAIEPPHQAIADGRVRVAVDAGGRRLGFSVVLPVEDGRCELDDLFVEPDSMRLGVGDYSSRTSRRAQPSRARAMSM